MVVTGGPRPPAVGDHGVMDWSTPWSQWSPASVALLERDGRRSLTVARVTETGALSVSGNR